jgi:hypothetical protein
MASTVRALASTAGERRGIEPDAGAVATARQSASVRVPA